MTFSNACEILGIASFPEEMNEIYEKIKKSKTVPFDREMMIRFQEAYGLFGDYYEDVLEGVDDLERDEARKVWAYTVAEFTKTHSLDDTNLIRVPKTDGTPAGHMAPLFPLVCFADRTYEEYRKRGFSHEDTLYYLKNYQRSLSVMAHSTGKPGLDQRYFDWSRLYSYVMIFRTGGFNFQICQIGKTHHVLRHRQTREVAVLIDTTVFHRDGMPLGSGPFIDEEGSFVPTYEETENEYIGYPTVDCLLFNNKKHFSKDEWELVCAPGDYVFGLHIPSGTDLSPECVAKAIDQAFEIAEKNFSEYQIKGLRCGSWLLSPQLKEMLGDTSRIVRFSALFSHYPIKNNGESIFHFAFGGRPADLHDLPEDTTLRRKAKALYLNGGCVFNAGGYILDKIGK